MWIDITVAVLAYLLGSMSSAIIICRIAGLPDPRSTGSGNPGATNVLRYGGKRIAALVLLGDMLKGLLPVLVAKWLDLEPLTVAVVGLLAFAGHLYPAFFDFRGGKGVATALGVILGIAWPVGVALAGIWLAIALSARISSLAAVGAALAAPIVTWWLAPMAEFVGAVTVLSLMLLWRHRSNIRNLMHGEEPRIGQKS